MQQIYTFIKTCRQRLNMQVLIDATTQAMLFGGLLTVITALFFIFNGYKVDFSTLCYLIIPVTLFPTLYFFIKRYDNESAGRFADDFFELKDGLTAACDFDSRTLNPDEQGFFELHLRQISKNFQTRQAREIPCPLPWKRIICASLYLILTGILLTYDDSDAVKATRALQQHTVEVTEDAKKELAEELKKLEDSLTDEEKALLEKTGLKEKLDELKSTNDKMAALKQFAALERELNKISNKLNPLSEQAMIQAMAKELQKNASTRELGEKMQNGKFDEAAAQLQKMADMKELSLQEQIKKSQQLQKTAQAMEKAAKSMKNNQSELGKQAQKLSSASKKMSQQLQQQNGQQSQKNGQQSGQQSQKQGQKLQTSARQMGTSMKKAGARQRLSQQLNNLKNSLNKSQKRLSQKPGAKQGRDGKNSMPGQKKGQGKKPGMGSDPFSSSNKTARDNGFDAQVDLQPSGDEAPVSVEEAESGSGNSGITRKKVNRRSMKRQMESFINRSDVPIPVRETVKEYFNLLHENEGGSDDK